jgi:ABC-2 type transport system permease protein
MKQPDTRPADDTPPSSSIITRVTGEESMTAIAPLLRFRNLVRELAITDFKLKYQGLALGYVWSLAKPLMLFAVLYLVFTRLIRLGDTVPHYALYLLLGVVLWSYFLESTLVAMVSVVDRGDLIRKVYFPRLVIPIATSISSLITLGLNLLVAFVFIAVTGVGFRPTLPLFALLLIELYVLSLGCSLLLAALYVKFRDIRPIWEVGLQLLFYASPIIYPLTIVPKRFAGIMALSPIAQIVEDSRKVLITPQALSTVDYVQWPFALLPYLIPPAVLVLGYWYFNSTAAKFAEEL